MSTTRKFCDDRWQPFNGMTISDWNHNQSIFALFLAKVYFTFWERGLAWGFKTSEFASPFKINCCPLLLTVITQFLDMFLIKYHGFCNTLIFFSVQVYSFQIILSGCFFSTVQKLFWSTDIWVSIIGIQLYILINHLPNEYTFFNMYKLCFLKTQYLHKFLLHLLFIREYNTIPLTYL